LKSLEFSSRAVQRMVEPD